MFTDVAHSGEVMYLFFSWGILCDLCDRSYVFDVLFACNLCFQCLSDNGSVLDTQVLGYHQQCHKSQGCCVSYTSLFVYFCDQYQQQHWEESPLLACIFLNIPRRCVCLSVLISHLFNLNSKCR